MYTVTRNGAYIYTGQILATEPLKHNRQPYTCSTVHLLCNFLQDTVCKKRNVGLGMYTNVPTTCVPSRSV